MVIALRNSEQIIVDALKKQKEEISNSSKLTNLVKLYEWAIDHHERNWMADNGIMIKSEPIDLQPLIDSVADEQKRNEEQLKLLDMCKDCSPDEDEEEQILYIKKNQLGMLTPDV